MEDSERKESNEIQRYCRGHAAYYYYWLMDQSSRFVCGALILMDPPNHALLVIISNEHFHQRSSSISKQQQGRNIRGKRSRVLCSLQSLRVDCWLWASSVATHRPRWGRRAFTDGVDLEECKCKLPIAEDGEGLLPQASCLPTMAAAVGNSQTGLISRSASASCR